MRNLARLCTTKAHYRAIKHKFITAIKFNLSLPSKQTLKRKQMEQGGGARGNYAPYLQIELTLKYQTTDATIIVVL